MRRFWLGVAVVLGLILLAMAGHYANVVIDFNEQAKQDFKDGRLLQR